MDAVPVANNPVWESAATFSGRLHNAVLSAGAEIAAELRDVLPLRVANLVVIDDGGPGGPGDVFTAIAQRYCRFPVLRVDSLEVPAFVGSDTVAIALGQGADSSTMADAVAAAASQGAQLLCLVDSSDLAVAGATAEANAVVRVVETVAPWTAPALAELLAPGLVLLEVIGALPAARNWVLEATHELTAITPRLIAEDGVAAATARSIGRTFPLFIGSGLLGEAAARSWKACFNMTCRAPAFASTLGDAATTELQGWGQHGDVTRQMFTAVVLRQEDEHPAVGVTVTKLLQELQEVTHAQVEVDAEGSQVFTQYLQLLLLGQLVALYRADQEGLVPGPTTAYPL